jgi:hypothetical protein
MAAEATAAAQAERRYDHGRGRQPEDDPPVTREHAERRAAALSAESSAHRWFARKGLDGWEVVKVALPPGVQLDPFNETVPHATQQTPAGPPPAHHRHVDGAGGAGGV